MSAEGVRLYKIYAADLATKGIGGTNECPCDFHQGHWSTGTAKTSSRAKTTGVQLTGDGCLASGANPPGLTGLSAWLPAPDVGTMFGFQRQGTVSVSPGPVAKTGYNCSQCNFKNDYARANQPNGTYLCFNCR